MSGAVDHLRPLTTAQVSDLQRARQLPGETRHVRFIVAGKALQLGSGQLVGGNVIYHPVYWDCNKAFVDLALELLAKNNPTRPVRVEYVERRRQAAPHQRQLR